MNTGTKRNKKEVSIELESRLIRLIDRLRNDFGHYRILEDGSEERGFYFYFIRSLLDLGYTLPGIKKDSDFDEMIKSKTTYRRLMKTLSAKFSRLFKGSAEAIVDLENYSSKKELVYYSTLGSLTVLELFVLTQGLTDNEILEIFRGKEYIMNLK